MWLSSFSLASFPSRSRASRSRLTDMDAAESRRYGPCSWAALGKTCVTKTEPDMASKAYMRAEAREAAARRAAATASGARMGSTSSCPSPESHSSCDEPEGGNARTTAPALQGE